MLRVYSQLMSLQFSQVTSNIIEAIVSVQRLSSFLSADELQLDARKVIGDLDPQCGDEVNTYFGNTCGEY